MRSFIVLLVIAVVTITFESAQAEYLAALNDYLVKNAVGDEVSSNMAAAVEWLKEQESSKHSIFSRSPVEGPKKFIALQRVIDDTQCDKEAYDIMHSNEQAAGLLRLKDDAIRRVDRVMLKIFEDHANKCFQVYPSIFAEKKERIDGKNLKQVKNIGDTVIGDDQFASAAHNHEYDEFYKDSENLYLIYIEDHVSIKQFTRDSLLDALALNVKGLPEAQYVRRVPDVDTGDMTVHKDKIKELVRDYLVRPCQQYVDAFGSDLFVPAGLDALYYDKPSGLNDDFIRGWVDYSICRTIAENKQVAVRDVLKAIKG